MKNGKNLKILALVLITFIILSGSSIVGATVAKPETRFIIGFHKEVSISDFASKYGFKVQKEFKFINAVSAEGPRSIMEALRGDKGIKYVEPNGILHVAGETLPWGVDRIDADLVHEYNKGTEIKVAVIDTGIDYDHPDLAANCKGGYDFVNNDNDPMDDHGHGTHCAGIIAAVAGNEIGVVGVAPEAHLYAVKVLDSSGSGYLEDVLAGIEWAVNNGMQIISMSLGTKSDYQSLHDACDSAYYENCVLLVAAAGNEATSWSVKRDKDTIIYPAKYDSVIAVGATDQNDKRASWSSTGPALELVAPGVDIYSTYWDDTYATKSGTSMACPHVSGTAALVFVSSVDPAYDSNGDGKWDASEVRQKLRDTADDLGDPGWDSHYGYGIVNAYKAAPGEDKTPPTISDLNPADGAVINDNTPTISAKVADASGINNNSIVMTLDKDNNKVEHVYDSGTGLVSYDVPNTEPLTEGLHKVTLSVADTVNNVANESWSFTVDTIPPPQVTGVMVTTVSSSQLDISWNAITEEQEPNLDYYNVYRSTSGDSYELVASPTENSYSDTGLTPSTIYFYIITAVDKAGNEGEPSEEASGKTEAGPVKKTYPPENVVITKGTISSGDYTSLFSNDGDYLEVKSAKNSYYKQVIDWYSYVKISENRSSVTCLTITYDGKYSASQTQKLYIYNFDSNEWEQIDSQTVGTSDVEITRSITSPASYISGEGEIRLRVYASNRKSFTCYADFVSYTIEY